MRSLNGRLSCFAVVSFGLKFSSEDSCCLLNPWKNSTPNSDPRVRAYSLGCFRRPCTQWDGRSWDFHLVGLCSTRLPHTPPPTWHGAGTLTAATCHGHGRLGIGSGVGSPAIAPNPAPLTTLDGLKWDGKCTSRIVTLPSSAGRHNAWHPRPGGRGVGKTR